MKRYEQTIRIRFGHCDPAGIVYHPQYFVILNQLMEDFYRDVAGVGFIEVKSTGSASLWRAFAATLQHRAAWATFARHASGSNASVKLPFGLRSRFMQGTNFASSVRKLVFA